MKITDSQVIKNGERELIDNITADLDWQTVEKIFREKHNIAIQDDVEYKQGDIVVYDNQVAYKIDFEVKVVLSVLLDRNGNYIAFKTSSDAQPAESDTDALIPDTESNTAEAQAEDEAGEETEPATCVNPNDGARENMSRMASELAEMISDINRD